jgi:hypothetical protein
MSNFVLEFSDIRLFMQSMSSQYTYGFVPCILTIQYTRFTLCIQQICTAKFSCEDLPHSAYSPNTHRFIPHILITQTDSFRVFSVYVQNSFGVFGKCAQIISNSRKGVIFNTGLKRTLLQKTACMRTTAPKTHKENQLFCSNLTKNYCCSFW